MKNEFGVPCSGIKDKIDPLFGCTSESEAMAIAAGATTVGEKPTVYMQNSGLMGIGDVVLSLYKPYGIPLPKLLLSVRNQPEHHKPTYEVTDQILEILGFEYYEKIQQQKGSHTGD